MRKVAMIIGLAAGLLVSLPGAIASTTQTVEGEILVGNPASCCTGGVNEIIGPSEFDGIDGRWITLDAQTTGVESVTLLATGDRAWLNDFDVYFYTADFVFIPHFDCATFLADEDCFAPIGADLAVVDLNIGAAGSFTFNYTYGE